MALTNDEIPLISDMLARSVPPLCKCVCVCVCARDSVINDGVGRGNEARRKIPRECSWTHVKEALTLQAGHVLNASWGYSAVHPATDGGVSTYTHAGVRASS